MKIDILGVKIDSVTKEEAVAILKKYLDSDFAHQVVTPNPEFIMAAQRDEEFKEILNNSSLAIADGFGLKLASWYLKQPFKERIAGVDFIRSLTQLLQNEKKSIYLLGAGAGVAKEAAQKLKKQYFHLKIVGAESCLKNNKMISDEEIIRNINLKSPQVLLVAFGAPKQEKWIARNLSKLNTIRIAMGVGGAFDFISGRVKRAPVLIRKLGLEWLFRFIIQPWRVKRIFTAAIKFPWAVIKSRKKNG